MKSQRMIQLKRSVGKAIQDFNLIQSGDRIAVAVSGGKDSWTMLHILTELQRRAPVSYELIPVNIDSGYPGYRTDVIAAHLKMHGYTFHMEKTEHYQIIQEKRRPGSSYCAICSRLKRGILYSLTRKLGCNKLALGHHRDDFIETLLLNQFFVGSLKAMSANMLADNGHTTVIRPLVYVPEIDIIELCRENSFPVVCCCCPVCGVVDMKRKRMKQLLQSLEKEIPHIKSSLMTALGNVHPRHLLDLSIRKEIQAPSDRMEE